MAKKSRLTRGTPFSLTDLTGRPISDFSGNKPAGLSERAILVGIEVTGRDTDPSKWAEEDSIRELGRLADTAGVEVLSTFVQRRSSPSPATYLGKGKLLELAGIIEDLEANLVIFDDNLTPGQLRNIESELKIKVVDRTELILDIFAARATTAVGKLQVELAQLTYLLPRLTKMWGHLAGQQGGVGKRGPGETQLETDRRQARKRIAMLKERLAEAEKRRELMREKRRRVPIPIISLVGYTNVGKSTLINALSKSAAFAEDKLFATLDPLVRRVRLDNNLPTLITDTVGFIKKLPITLVDAFHATLEEVRESDLLILVIDGSDEMHIEQTRVVREVLVQIGAGDIPVITAINKIDRLGAGADRERAVQRLTGLYPGAVPIAARTGEGTKDLLHTVEYMLRDLITRVYVKIAPGREKLLAHLHETGQVVSTTYGPDGTADVVVNIPIRHAHIIPEDAIAEPES